MTTPKRKISTGAKIAAAKTAEVKRVNAITDGQNTVVTMSLTHKKTTPGTEVYEDVTKKHPVSQVYVAKSAFPGEAPPAINLTISF